MLRIRQKKNQYQKAKPTNTYLYLCYLDKTMPTETEVKIKIDNLEVMKAKILEMRAEPFKKRVLQIDYAYDNKNKLKKNGECLRIRDNAIPTYKGPKQKGSKMKIREEIEVMVD